MKLTQTNGLVGDSTRTLDRVVLRSEVALHQPDEVVAGRPVVPETRPTGVAREAMPAVLAMQDEVPALDLETSFRNARLLENTRLSIGDIPAQQETRQAFDAIVGSLEGRQPLSERDAAILASSYRALGNVDRIGGQVAASKGEPTAPFYQSADRRFRQAQEVGRTCPSPTTPENKVEAGLCLLDWARLLHVQPDKTPETTAQQAKLLHQAHARMDGVVLDGKPPIEMAYVCTSQGRLFHTTGHDEQAVDCFRQACDVYRQHGSEFEIVPSFWLIRLGGVARDERIPELLAKYPRERLTNYAKQDGFAQDVWQD